jgi:uncharacterized protein (DUF1501 family)
MKTKRHKPLQLTRRSLLQVAGVNVIGGAVTAFAPRNVEAAGKGEPIGTARQVLFLNLDGGMSQVDTFDAKECAWTPDTFDLRTYPNDLKLPYGLMPNLTGLLDKLTVVRSMAAWDAVHGRAQYYIQTGHPLNQALAKEVPAIGAVVCHELAKTRKPSDTLPPYIAMNMAGNQAGLINQGFMSAEFGPLALAVGAEGPPSLAPDKSGAAAMRRRYERLQQLDASLRKGEKGRDRSFTDFNEYYRGAWSIVNDPRVAGIFSITPEERSRYGGSSIGNSLVLARNLFRADAGTRFVLASHGGWDHHGDIYKDKTRNHLVLIRELDAALSNLIRDLEASPSATTKGKSLLDETLIVAMSEFGRTPGALSATRAGREHFIHLHSGLFAGGGVRRGAVIGKSDDLGSKVVDPGWSGGRPIYMEDIACTIYSALGIDWTKKITSTPSGRAFHYVEPASGTQYVRFQPVKELFS